MIESGYIRRLLERLIVLQSAQDSERITPFPTG
jgi:hypothetical protein